MLKSVETLKPSEPGGTQEQKLLVERVAASRYIGKSTRLRDLLVYLCNRVLEDGAAEIHEQEVGHSVFGRALNYDTTIDNIVRVHASQLRKRLAQYFSSEGLDEAWVIEIPKGNYAPVFHERIAQEPSVAAVEAELPPAADVDTAPVPARALSPLVIALAALALVFAISTAVLVVKLRAASAPADTLADRPTVRLFWSQIFHPGVQTDIVLDDATIGLFQELTGKTVGITDYFDRSYLRKLDEMAAGSPAGSRLDAKQANALVLRRYSSYSSSHLLWRLFQAAGPQESQATVYFARDYGFRGIKGNNVILLGYSRSNPWMESFEDRLGLRWTFEASLGIYLPEDKLAASGDGRFHISADPGDREGYFMAALAPNLGATGKVLMISGTGGSAINSGGDLLMDEAAMSRLRSMLPGSGEFPYFEALFRIKSRSPSPKDVEVVLARPLRK